eukprot:scaffold87971_cov66-Phaeocystis_antarctica.AAC.4
MSDDIDGVGDEIIAALLEASTSKRPRPNSQRCRTCDAPNKWETDPPHKKPKGKGDPSCPFPWKEKPDPALIGKQAALELVRTYTLPAETLTLT